MRIGYKRISSIAQNDQRQLINLTVDKMFTDKVSGKDIKNRPALLEMMDYARENDEVFFHSFDRASRSLKDLLTIIEALTGKGVIIHFLKENLSFTKDNDNPMARLQLHMMASIYEFERSLINDRIREGVAIAKKAGKYKGRKPTLSEDERMILVSKHKDGAKISELSKEYGISRPTVYKYLKAE